MHAEDDGRVPQCASCTDGGVDEDTFVCSLSMEWAGRKKGRFNAVSLKRVLPVQGGSDDLIKHLSHLISLLVTSTPVSPQEDDSPKKLETRSSAEIGVTGWPPDFPCENDRKAPGPAAIVTFLI